MHSRVVDDPRAALQELRVTLDDRLARAEGISPSVYRVLLAAREEAASHLHASEVLAEVKHDATAGAELAARGLARVRSMLFAVG